MLIWVLDTVVRWSAPASWFCVCSGFVFIAVLCGSWFWWCLFGAGLGWCGVVWFGCFCGLNCEFGVLQDVGVGYYGLGLSRCGF